MYDVRDENDSLLCKIDERTGWIESKHGRIIFGAQIDIGKKLYIEKRGIRTIITRLENGLYNVDSYKV